MLKNVTQCLQKYYPPDFDPSKIPRMKLAKNRQYTVRLMAPFNMRCVTCGEYIYKGKKFNARKEDVENEDYLGIRIYRFYIKCTRCLQEISFKTDPRNTDYEIEAGATRNFMALKLAEEQAKKEEEELREEEANNPMKLLENRTQQSRNEIELLESLEELRDLNRRQQTIDYDTMLLQYDNTETEREKEERQQREDEELIKSVKFKTPAPKTSTSSAASGSGGTKRIIKEEIIDVIDDLRIKKEKLDTNLVATAKSTSIKLDKISVGGIRSNLSNLVKKKQPTQQEVINNPVAIATEEPVEKAAVTNPATGGLAMLGAYSDSENSDNNSD